MFKQTILGPTIWSLLLAGCNGPSEPSETGTPGTVDTSNNTVDTSNNTVDTSNNTVDTSNSDTGNSTVNYPTLSTGLQTFIHDGMDREFYIHIPTNMQPNAPLMLIFHGYSGSYQSIMGYSSMNDQADLHGFVAVYPQGTTDQLGYNFFNAGYSFHSDSDVDDVSFTRELVDFVVDDLQLNRDAVFSTGMSNGGDMSYHLACEAYDIIRAIAPIAGTMMTGNLDSCLPTKEMPVFEVHGTADRVTWYDGDPDNTGGWGAYLSVDDTIAFWVAHNGLDLTEETLLPNTEPTDGSVVMFQRNWSDANPTEVWLYKVERGGHDWPGFDGNMDIDTSAEIWKFFSSYVQ